MEIPSTFSTKRYIPVADVDGLTKIAGYFLQPNMEFFKIGYIHIEVGFSTNIVKYFALR